MSFLKQHNQRGEVARQRFFLIIRSSKTRDSRNIPAALNREEAAIHYLSPRATLN